MTKRFSSLDVVCLIVFLFLVLLYFIFYSQQSALFTGENGNIERRMNYKLKLINNTLNKLMMKLELKDSKTKLQNVLHFVKSLPQKERRVFSQNKEDGVLEAIFDYIKPQSKYYVEFGVQSGVQCNTRYFREKKNWTGLMMDGGYSNKKINLHKEFIYSHNIVSLFEKYNVPKKFDLFSEDTDFKDFWIIKAVLDAGYRPRVIVSEINNFLGGSKQLSIPLESNQTRWDGSSQYFGYSVGAGWLLAKKYDYSMIYCESEAVNCFYVINGIEGFGDNIRLSDHLSSESLWRNPSQLRHKKDNLNRPYSDVAKALFPEGVNSDKVKRTAV